MSDRELIISSAVVVQPGDKVLLTLPPDAAMSSEELGEIKEHLVAWAPGVDWLLVAGANAVIHVPAERTTP